MIGTILLVAFILALGSIIFTGIYVRNKIVHRKNLLRRAWSDVIAWQRKKINVIPELEKGMQEYGQFEASTQSKLTSLRKMIGNLSKGAVDTQQLEKTQILTRDLMSGLNATFEAYANLKTSDLYLRWMKELSEIEDNIAAAISVFNAAVQLFNDSIQEFPGNVINENFNHEKFFIPFNDSNAEAGLEYKPDFAR